MSETRRRFDPEFCEGAVRIVFETRRPIARVACELGVNEGTLGDWVARDRAVREDGEQPLVAALMREQRLAARPRRRRRWVAQQDPAAPVYRSDGVKRDFWSRDRPNRVWVGDLTEIPTGEGLLCLASVEDLHSRRLPGFATGEHHDAALAKAALCMAIAVRGGQVDGVVFPSDRGGEHTGSLFAKACAEAGVTQSMGRTGTALDNAAAESFNSTLEFELLRESRFATKAEARAAVAAFVDEYNTSRLHSTLGMLSPIEYEARQREPAA